MKKCGLRKAYAGGGFIDPMGNNYAAINAKSNAESRMNDVMEQMKYGKPSMRAALAPTLSAMQAGYNQDFMTPGANQRKFIDQTGNNFNAINAQSDAESRMDDVMEQMKYGKPSMRKALAPTLATMQAGYNNAFENGGTVGADPEALMRQMAAKYGTTGAAQATPVAAPAPAPAPAPVAQAPVPKRGILDGLRRFATGDLEGRMKAAGFAKGGEIGVDNKGFIHGPKGVDKVPARVDDTGEEIRVGAGERIVNQEQNAALEALAAEAGMSLDEYLESSTGEKVGPTLKQGLRAHNLGGKVDDFGNYINRTPNNGIDPQVKSAIAAQQRAAMNAPPTPAEVAHAAAPKTPPPVASTPTPTAAASAPTRAGGLMAGVKSFASSPWTLAPAMMQAGAAAIDAIDSIPSLRGQHTATSTDMSIPEHTRVVADQNDMAARDVNWEKRHGAALPDDLKTPPVVKPPVVKSNVEHLRAANDAVLNQTTSTVNGKPAQGAPTASLEQYIQTQEQKNPNVAGLRAAGVNGAVMGDVTVNGKTGQNGIRTITTQNGNVYAGRDAKGQLHISSNAGSNASDQDAARDARFEAAGYKKDGYGNWITPNRIADKEALGRIQRERAEFAAFSPDVTDPNARKAGLAAHALKYGPGDKLAADAASKAADRQVTLRGQDITARGQDISAQNSSREFGFKVNDANSKDVAGWMDTMVPTSGLKGEELNKAQARRAMLQQTMMNHWGGNIPSDRAKFQQEMPEMARQAEATMRIYDVLSSQGIWDRLVRNGGKKSPLSLQALSPKAFDPDSGYLIMPDGYRVKGEEIWGNNADMRAAILGRIQ